ncbi:MAG: hypothetical protein NTW06_04775 [Candidatus Falkowbacteria bacterium]|nr:hypothetical protein [Candidatus Falkowbacteria bacterium]
MLAVTAIFLAIMLGQLGLVTMRYKLNKNKVASSQALHIAEAGVNYYRWVLYHDHDEYISRGCTSPGNICGPFGPYAYKDSAGGTITGYYKLYITPPATNGPSWSSYSTLADDYMRFGVGTDVQGPIHSNLGIRFDGVAHHVVSSASATTTEPSGSRTEFGVYNYLPSMDPVPDGNNPPLNMPDKPNIFIAGRSFPVTTVSFSLLNNYIGEVYKLATSAGIVFDPAPAGTADPASRSEYWGCGTSGSTCDEGFHIALKTDNTFNIRGVTAVVPDCGTSTNSIDAEQADASARNYNIPANGIIFVKKRIWVDGQINNSRVTILAFNEPIADPNGTADINLGKKDLSYTNYDGTDAIGLIAQRDVNIGLDSKDNLRIDAALIAKNGRIGRYYYTSGCVNYKRNTITVYGSLSTKKRYGFSYICGTTYCSGYDKRYLIYDNNLTFAPPPHYPTTGEYTFISWKEN